MINPEEKLTIAEGIGPFTRLYKRMFPEDASKEAILHVPGETKPTLHECLFSLDFAAEYKDKLTEAKLKQYQDLIKTARGYASSYLNPQGHFAHKNAPFREKEATFGRRLKMLCSALESRLATKQKVNGVITLIDQMGGPDKGDNALLAALLFDEAVYNPEKPEGEN